MSFLGSLVGRIEQGAQNAEHTIGNAVNNAVHGGQPAPASTASPQQSPFPTINGQRGPFSPAYMAANGAGPMPVQPVAAPRVGADYSGIQQSTSLDGGLQGYTQDDLSNGLQGGVVNQGYIPLQNSGFGVGVGQGGDAQNLLLRSILNR